MIEETVCAPGETDRNEGAHDQFLWVDPEAPGNTLPKAVVTALVGHTLGRQGTFIWQLARAPRSEDTVAFCYGVTASGCRGQSTSLELVEMSGSSGEASYLSKNHSPLPSAPLLQKVLEEKGEEKGWLQPRTAGEGRSCREVAAACLSGCACRRGPALSSMNSPSGNLCLVVLGKELGLVDAEGDGVLPLFEEHMVYMCVGGGAALPCCVQ